MIVKGKSKSELFCQREAMGFSEDNFTSRRIISVCRYVKKLLKRWEMLEKGRVGHAGSRF